MSHPKYRWVTIRKKNNPPLTIQTFARMKETEICFVSRVASSRVIEKNRKCSWNLFVYFFLISVEICEYKMPSSLAIIWLISSTLSEMTFFAKPFNLLD